MQISDAFKFLTDGTKRKRYDMEYRQHQMTWLAWRLKMCKHRGCMVSPRAPVTAPQQPKQSDHSGGTDGTRTGEEDIEDSETTEGSRESGVKGNLQGQQAHTSGERPSLTGVATDTAQTSQSDHKPQSAESRKQPIDEIIEEYEELDRQNQEKELNSEKFRRWADELRRRLEAEYARAKYEVMAAAQKKPCACECVCDLTAKGQCGCPDVDDPST